MVTNFCYHLVFLVTSGPNLASIRFKMPTVQYQKNP